MIRRLLVVAVACANAVSAQSPRLGIINLARPGDDADARARVAQLTADTVTSGFLLRSVSTMTALRDGATGGPVIRLVAPRLDVVSNSAIPNSLNDGALWAGRGTSSLASVGADVRWWRLHVVVAPELRSEANEAFQVIPYPQSASPRRSVWANPFHGPPESLDAPLRFGDAPFHGWEPGQSSLTLDFGRAAAGVATENVWWGPGIRNALVLSGNAAGFPHAFVRTPRPLESRWGSWEGAWLLGALRESQYFDSTSANDSRSLSGLALTFRPAGERGLTVGLARIVVAPLDAGELPVSAALNVLRTVGHPYDGATTTAPAGPDQITSLFGRWVFPSAGLETWLEWARFEEPRSLRDLLEFPQHSQGYTLGLQWVRPAGPARMLRLQGELTYLEPDPSYRLRSVATTYTSAAVAQGFTHRGQVLGAAIGPGASSQWLAADLLGASWSAGGFLSRIRWDNGVLFERVVPDPKRPDVSLSAGLRAAVNFAGLRVAADFTRTTRINYLFQAYVDDAKTGETSGVDIANRSLTLSVSGVPRVPWGAR